MHPVELSEVFNGFDSRFSNQSWASMLPEVDSFFEWAVANRQNAVEWVPLASENWPVGFVNGTLRQGRFRKLVDMAHEYGLAAGCDVPIALRQQHSWYMVESTQGSLAQQKQEIATRLDWLLGDDAAGFDFVNTESGTTEFSHPACDIMLAWMNHTAEWARLKHGKKVFIKCHCSHGQTCKDKPDPATGKPLNFNFLPELAVPSLGVAPHTVQTYSFNDPAPTYGNSNFSFMLDWAVKEAPKRDVLFYGETAYWVNYDIDVPLFLGALYGDRRIKDIRTLRARANITGQDNFCSGWEWAYWLGDVMTARAAWHTPSVEEASDEEALALGLRPLTGLLDATAGGDGCRNGCTPGGMGATVEALLMEVVAQQKELLIFGGLDPNSPGVDGKVKQRNGHAYLEGWDTDAELEAFGAAHFHSPLTQPDRLPLPSFLARGKDAPYEAVRPLLSAMATNFTALAAQWLALGDLPVGGAAVRASPHFSEIYDSMAITARRAKLVRALYEAANYKALGLSLDQAKALLAEARGHIVNASSIVARREGHYRVPVSRVAGWLGHDSKEAPLVTAYQYGFLWTVHQLVYFWRDYGRVHHLIDGITNSSSRSYSPCYLNFNAPADVGLGPGILASVSNLLEKIFGKAKGAELIAECVAPPSDEIVLPRDL